MSSLIFCTDETQVLTATDTLAVSHPKGAPFCFTTKSFIVPHLRMIICGTGAGGFAGRWFVEVNDRMVVRGIDHLDWHTPRNLNSLWTKYQEEFFIESDVTTTIYHFGFSEIEGVTHSYAYRSTNNFQSERLPSTGLGVKPYVEVPEGIQFPTDIKTLMDRQRANQQALPEEERVYIGGEIQIHHLTPDGFNVYTLDRFEDYDADEQAIYENFANY